MKAIVCMNPERGIGYANAIPWKSKKDMSFFKEKTTGKGNNAVVMGYNTFRSIGFRPLPNRRNYIMTHSSEAKSQYHGSDVIFESNLHNILFLNFIFDEVYVIGGESIYTLFEPYINEIYITTIHIRCIVNYFFTVDLSNFHKKLLKKEKDENGVELEFYHYKKKDPEDFL